MRFENRLRPFVSEHNLRVRVRSASEMSFADDESTYEHFGFRANSKQARFFTRVGKGTENRVVGVLYEGRGEAPTSLTDPRVVCRLFGTLDRDASLELWHISVNARNHLNDSERGRRWGIHNLVSHVEGRDARTRWTSADTGVKLTPRNARAHVRGTPNPYAVECLVRCVEHIGCPSVRQHDDMPCAKLFDAHYDHKTHPSTLLLYEALKFTRPPGLSHYVWIRAHMPSLIYSYEQSAQRMFFGLPVV